MSGRPCRCIAFPTGFPTGRCPWPYRGELALFRSTTQCRPALTPGTPCTCMPFPAQLSPSRFREIHARAWCSRPLVSRTWIGKGRHVHGLPGTRGETRRRGRRWLPIRGDGVGTEEPREAGAPGKRPIVKIARGSGGRPVAIRRITDCRIRGASPTAAVTPSGTGSDPACNPACLAGRTPPWSAAVS